MRAVHTRICATAILVAVAAGPPVAARQSETRALTLPITGTVAGGGVLSGTATINRFAQRNNEIVAVGFVSGVVSRDGRAVGSALAGSVVWPVALRSGGIAAVKGPNPGTSGIRQIAHARAGERPAGFVLAQAQSCPVLDIAIGATDVNLLGVDVALAPVGLTLTGDAGTPLGDLVCAVSGLLGNVAGLINLLNSILGLLTGLLGGVTGGIGGIVP
jgi:hypothetical protein